MTFRALRVRARASPCHHLFVLIVDMTAIGHGRDSGVKFACEQTPPGDSTRRTADAPLRPQPLRSHARHGRHRTPRPPRLKEDSAVSNDDLEHEVAHR